MEFLEQRETDLGGRFVGFGQPPFSSDCLCGCRVGKHCGNNAERHSKIATNDFTAYPSHLWPFLFYIRTIKKWQVDRWMNL